MSRTFVPACALAAVLALVSIPSFAQSAAVPTERILYHPSRHKLIISNPVYRPKLDRLVIGDLVYHPGRDKLLTSNLSSARKPGTSCRAGLASTMEVKQNRTLGPSNTSDSATSK